MNSWFHDIFPAKMHVYLFIIQIFFKQLQYAAIVFVHLRWKVGVFVNQYL